MATEATTVFNGNLDTTGTRTDAFTQGDYILIIAPTLKAQGIDLEVDAFLQLVFSDNTQRLIRLDPVNVLDTSAIALIPAQFKKGNDRDLYLFLLATQPYLVEVIVVSNTDDDLEEIKDKLDELQTSEQTEDATDIARTIVDIIRLAGGDVTAALPLFRDVVSGIDSLEGIDLPALPESVDTLPELESFF